MPVWNTDIASCTMKEIIGVVRSVVHIPKIATRTRESLTRWMETLSGSDWLTVDHALRALDQRGRVTVSDLAHIRHESLVSALDGVIGIPYAIIRTRKAMKEHLLQLTGDPAVRVKNAIRRYKDTNPYAFRKAGIPREGIIAPSEEEPEQDNSTKARAQRLLTSPFMTLPNEETLLSCLDNYIESTGKKAYTKVICCVCAQNVPSSQAKSLKVEELPNKDILEPSNAHPAHDVFDGALLHGPAVHAATSETHMCNGCGSHLAEGKLPPLSLANDMFIGQIPFALECLTLPERILIAKWYPVAYIVKLYPKYPGARSKDASRFHRGLRGNVSTHPLAYQQISDIVDGTVLPARSSILSSTIAVTFVGPGKVPLGSVPKAFLVRRRRVADALVWLKANNPLYADIHISEERLRDLPVEGIPPEILANVRHTEDTTYLDAEQDSYVPGEYPFLDEDDDRNMIFDNDEGEGIVAQPRENDVVLQSSGVIDVAGHDVPNHEIMVHALANTGIEDQNGWQREDRFTIPYGSAFVSEYARRDEETGERFDGGPGNPNHLLGAFPVLFPYGIGGLETRRRKDVPYELHVRWALAYADKRFRIDHQFIFQVFGVMQKRKVCRSAKLQVKRASFQLCQAHLSLLKPADFIKAAEEETRRMKLSNPHIQALRRQVTAIRARVTGTDEARASLRSKISGTNLMFNLPSLWITINPSDSTNPIAQVLGGADIDLDNFVNVAVAPEEEREIRVATDPASCAEFFHSVIDAVLKHLIGLDVSRAGTFRRKAGIFGIPQAYVGSVEAQGRGTLHLHMLLWLKGAPPASVMKTALESDAFKAKVVEFIKGAVSGDIGGRDADAIKAMPKAQDLVAERPMDSKFPNFAGRVRDVVDRLARTLQVHVCSPTAYLKTIKSRLRCKRGAPWSTSDGPWVKGNGEWGPKRLWGMVNNFNRTILQAVRCNHDVKLLTNASETVNVSWYMAIYATKKRLQTNASALLARAFAFNSVDPAIARNAQERNRKLVTQCSNALNRDQEFSGPEVASYLMGYKDHFLSHLYIPIYWDSCVAAMFTVFPALKEASQGQSLTSEITRIEHSGLPNPETTIECREGAVKLRDQVKQYQDRGENMANLSFLRFFLDTYETFRACATTRSASGRRLNRRESYGPESRRKGKRVFRSKDHETLPQIIGRWLPNRDDPKVREFYCASILFILRPWTNLKELKQPGQTFESAFKEQHWTSNELDTMEAIQYFHDASKPRPKSSDNESHDEDEDHPYMGDEEEDNHVYAQLTEEDIETARVKATNGPEALYAADAMAKAETYGIFKSLGDRSGEAIPFQARAEPGGQEKFKYWADTLKRMVKGGADIGEDSGQSNIRPTVFGEIPIEPSIRAEIPDGTVSRMRDHLNVKQRSAHDRIERHLLHTLSGERTSGEPLQMMVLGHGGTGKTALINAVTETFEIHRASHLLAKTGTTGIAASMIDGVTIHYWAGLPSRLNVRRDACQQQRWVETASKEVRERRQENIVGTWYLIIDECSMMTRRLLAMLSEVTAKMKAHGGEAYPNTAFGGMNVIMFGDFHQFPPVAAAWDALYETTADNAQSIAGRAIYEGFTDVIFLTQQMRVIDPVWQGILSRLRTGDCTEEDVAEIESLSLENLTHLPDWDSPPWNEASLVTPRNSVRMKWNTARLRKDGQRKGRWTYISPAEDYESGTGVALEIADQVAVAGMKVEKKGKLRDTVEIAVGMEVMVLLNMATQNDIANGSRGIVHDIILDEREGMLVPNENGEILLEYPPAMVVFRPHRSTVKQAIGELQVGCLPIVPTEVSFAICDSKGAPKKVKRRQFSLAPAFAFTDYKSQGQTLRHVLVDLAAPKNGKLDGFHVYVALSRSPGRDFLRILRKGDREHFTTHPSEALRREDQRLENVAWLASLRED